MVPRKHLSRTPSERRSLPGNNELVVCGVSGEVAWSQLLAKMDGMRLCSLELSTRGIMRDMSTDHPGHHSCDNLDSHSGTATNNLRFLRDHHKLSGGLWD
jgi:hypothetical protein